MLKFEKDSIARYVKSLKEKSVTPNETKRKLQSISRFIKWAVTTGYLEQNDFKQMESEIANTVNDSNNKTKLGETANSQLSTTNFRSMQTYIAFAVVLIFISLIGFGLYNQFFKKTSTPFAYPTALTPGSRIISFQGRLTDSIGNPIIAPIDLTYKFYTVSTGGSPITGSTRVCTASPDQDGVFANLIGSDPGPSCTPALPATIFSENPQVWLGVTVGSELTEMSPRQQIANVGYAINAETLQGFPPGTTASTIPFISTQGDLLIAAATPGIRSTYTTANFVISSAKTTTIQSANAGDIVLSATDGGALRFNTFNGSLVERITVLSGGNVGIGSTSPTSFKLEVAGNIGPDADNTRDLGSSSRYYANIYANNIVGSGALGYWKRGVGTLYPNVTSDAIAATSSGTTVATFTATGSNNALRAGGASTFMTVNSSGNMTITGTGSNTVMGTWDFGNYNLNNANHISMNDGGPNEGLGWADSTWLVDTSPLDRSNATGNLNLYGTTNNIALWRPTLWVYNATNYSTATAQSSGGLDFTSTGTGHISFNPGGNVGIGTTSPLEKLTVTGSASVSANLTIGQTGTLRSQYGPLNLAYKSGLNAWTTGLTLQDSTGNVGIGSANPGAFKLEVAGNIGPDADNTRDLGSSSRYYANIYANNIVGSGALGYWRRGVGTLYPNVTSDAIAATSSGTTVATFTATGTNDALRAGGNTNYATLNSSGNLTFTNAGVATITGPTTGLTIDATTGALNFGTSANARTITIGNVTGTTAVNVNTGSAGTTYTTTNGIYTLNTGTGTISLGTDAVAKTINIGNTTTTTGLALNSGTGDIVLTSTDQIKLNSSKAAGGTTTEALSLKSTVDLGVADELLQIGDSAADFLTVLGNGNVGIGTALPSSLAHLYSTSTSTSFTGFNLDWSPGSATTTTGDLFALNIGTNGTASTLFNVKDTGSSLFSVSETAVTSNLPTSFTSAGDVSIAYDLLFTNPTSSYIKSSAPLYIQAGEVFGSSDLTLKTYNNGDIVLDAAGGVTLAQAQPWSLATSTTALNIQSGLLNLDTTNARVGIGTTAPNVKLDVKGTSALPSGDPAIIAGNVTDGMEIRLGTNATSDYGWIQVAERGVSYSRNLVLQNEGGNVGIGTTSPTSFKLEVAGNIGPDADNTRDLGSSSRYYANIYANNIVGSGALGYWRRGTGVLFPNTLTDGLAATTSATTVATFTSTGSNNALLAGGASNNITIGSTGSLTFNGVTNDITTGTNEHLALMPNGTGNVGVGTTSPLQKLHVEGQCVAAGTLIRRRRRKKNGEYEEEDVPVEDIEPGDNIMSLNEFTGAFEWQEVEKVMNMGIQETFALTTSSNKKILTTANHPYLAIDKPTITQGTFEVDQSIRIEELGKPTIIGIALGNMQFTAKLLPETKKEILRTYQKTNKPALFAVHTFAYAVAQTCKAADIYPSRMIIDTEYSGFDRPIRDIIKLYLPDTNVLFGQIGKHSPAHTACWEVNRGKKKENTILKTDNLKMKKDRGHEALRTLSPRSDYLGSNRPHGPISRKVYFIARDLSRAKWKKVSTLSKGQYIATLDRFEKITGIQKVKRLQTYDLQIARTHNFVGNGIVAHNTYINGNVGIGTTSPGQALTIGDGGIEIIRTSNPFLLFDQGGTDVGQLRALDTTHLAVTNGAGGSSYLTVDTSSGNVGIGTTSPTSKLHVEGQCVTGDTLLRRRRRRRRRGANGEWIEEEYWENVRIDQIREGDEIQTLDEETGRLVFSKVKALMDMGRKPIIKLTTASGKTIKTTAEHPYLIKQIKQKRPRVGIFYDAANLYFAGKRAGWKVDPNKLYSLIAKEADISLFNIYIAVPAENDTDRQGTMTFVKHMRKEIDVKTKPVKYIQAGRNIVRKGDVDVEIVLDIARNVEDLDLIILVSGDSDYLELVHFVEHEHAKQIAFMGFKRNMAWELRLKKHLFVEKIRDQVELGEKKNPARGGATILPYLYQDTAVLSRGRWTKAKNVKVKDEIAIAGRFNTAIFEKVAKIEYLPVEEVYDIEVEGTHNFVGNGIVAHNTYINGNVGIGTTGPDFPLHVVGTLHTADGAGGRIIQMSRGTGYSEFLMDNNVNNLYLRRGSSGTNYTMYWGSDGNVGIGTTSPGAKLDIVDATANATKLRVNYGGASRVGTNLYSVGDDAGGSIVFGAEFGSTNDASYGIPTKLTNYAGRTVFGLGASLMASGSRFSIYGANGGANQSVSEYLTIKDSGNVGIGTTSPTSKFHVEGQCVTGDTKLRRRRRRRRADGTWDEYWEDVPIKDIAEGDEILTLEETTGAFVVSTVKQLMDKGIKDIWKLTTASGKTIRTTANHPYLALTDDKQAFAFVDEAGVGQAPDQPIFGVAAIFTNDSLRLNRKLHDIFTGAVSAYNINASRFEFKFNAVTKNNLRFFTAIVQALAADTSWSFAAVLTKKNKRWNYWNSYLRILPTLIAKAPFAKVTVVADYLAKPKAARDDVKSIATLDKVANLLQLESQGSLLLQVADVLLGALHFEERQTSLGLATGKEAKIALATMVEDLLAKKITAIEWLHAVDPNLPQIIPAVKRSRWTKVKDLAENTMIATVDGWERIERIERLAAEQVYDIEVENTHNFVGNGIVAHNTYINGNVGIGTTGPLDKLHIAAANTPVGLGEFVGSNLIYNGGAEDGTTGWTSRDFGVDASAGSGSTSGTALSGSSSFLAQNDGGLNQSVELLPGSIYTINLRMRVNNQGVGDASQGRIVVGTTATGRETVDQTCNPNDYDATPNTNKWVSCSATFTATNTSDVKTVTMYVGFRAEGNTHSVLVDNIMLVRGAIASSYSPLTTFVGSNGAAVLTGNVGIGTTGPTQKLHVEGNVRTGGNYVQDVIVGWRDGYILQRGSNGYTIGMASNGTDLQFGAGTTLNDTSVRLTVTNAGNVGIGTTGPGDKLHLYNGNLLLEEGYGMSVSDTQAGAINMIRYASATDQLQIGSAVASGLTGGITFDTAGAGGTAVTIDNAGNVGIGTTGPAEKLQVVGNTRADSYYMSAISASGLDVPTSTYNLSLHGQSNVTGDILMRPSWATTGGAFRVQANTTDVLTVLMTGNVGIGTTSPAASSLLDLTSTAKGFLAPRMTTVQRDAIATPATGLMIYNTTTNAYNVYNGTSWGTIGGGVAGSGTLNYVTKWTPDGSTLGNSIIYDTGTNVGIGTTSPGAKLAVGTSWQSIGIGDILGKKAIFLGTNDNFASTAYFGIQIGPTGYVNDMAISGSSDSVTQRYLHIGYNTSDAPGSAFNPKVSINTYSGNVGIGTTGPVGKLDIMGGSSPTLGGRFIADDNGNYSPRMRLYRWTGSASNYYPWHIVNSSGVMGALEFMTGSNTTLGGETVTTKMLIDSSGNVGIGTTSPGTYKLNVYGSDNNNLVASVNSAGPVMRIQANATGTYLDSTGVAAMYIDNEHASGYMAFRPGSAVEKMRLSSTGGLSLGNSYTGTDPGAGSMIVSGNVGIGTTSPVAKLDVAGSAIFRVSGTENKFNINNDNNVGIELRSETSGGQPYIDFTNDGPTDYDARIQLESNDSLVLHGAALKISNNLSNGTRLYIDAGASQTVSNPLVLLRDSGGNELMRIHSDNPNNTFVGYRTGIANVIGGAQPYYGLYNNFFGTNVGQANTSGWSNSGFGTGVLYYNTTGNDNSGFGINALNLNTTGTYNSAFGGGALQNNTTGNWNIGIGTNTLFMHTSDNSSGGNIALGVNSGYWNVNGLSNTYLGTEANHYGNTSYGTSVGRYALYNLRGGGSISSFADAGGGNVTVTTSVAHYLSNGDAITIKNSTNYNGAYTVANAASNTYTIVHAYVAETPAWNTMWHFTSPTGNFNTAFGYGAGNYLVRGDGNIYIGPNAGPSSATTESNKLYINNSAGTPLIYGDFTTGRVGIGTTSPDAKLDVTGGALELSNSGNTVRSVLTSTIGNYLSIEAFNSDNSAKYPVSINPWGGNVGIGTTNPTNRFFVNLGASQLARFNDGINASGLTLQNGSILSQSSQFQIAATSTNPLSFYTGATINSMTAGTERMRIATNGNVGIGGALNTNAQLDLNGGTILAGQYCPTSTCLRYIVPNGTSRIDLLQIASDLPNNTGYLSFLDANNSYVKIASISAQATGTVVIDNTATNITDVGYPSVPDLCVGDPYWCTGKVDAGTIDPPYTINGKKYATYLTAMTGVKEETTGTIATQFPVSTLSKAYAVKVIDFNDLREASDLWLFSKTTNLRKNLEKMTVLLTPSDDTRTWYKVNSATHSLTIYSSRPTTISYRLTAPRFDGERWTNENPGGSGGFQLNDPDQPSLIALNQTGDISAETFKIISISNTQLPNPNSQYTMPNIYKIISDKTGDFVEEVGVFARITVAQIKAGFIETENAVVNNILLAKNIIVQEKIISPVVETAELKTDIIQPKNDDLTINLAPTDATKSTASVKSGALGRLIINGLNNKAVASIDAEGNATFAGTLTSSAVVSSQLLVNNATISGSLNASDASLSGTLIAKEIHSENIDQLSTINSQLSTDINAVQAELARIKNNTLSDAQYYQNLDSISTSSALIATNLNYLQPVLTNITVTKNSNLYNASIANSLTAGNIFIQNNEILSLSWELRLSALAQITLFDGSVTIAKNGNITTEGELIAKGGIRTDIIQPTENGKDVTIKLNGGTAAVEDANGKLKIENSAGSEVASIDASGSAKFNALGFNRIATNSALIADSGLRTADDEIIPALQTNAEAAGQGVLPAGAPEIVIYNDKITKNSLVYLTPISNNQYPITNIQSPLTIAKKESCLPAEAFAKDGLTTNCKPYFSVSAGNSPHGEIKFNWLIIN